VRADQASQYIDDLGCSATPSCPGVNVCDASLAPRCIGGVCQLAEASADSSTGGDTLCGTPSLGACPAGFACVLNDPEANDADQFGVGVCRPE
jgi:hypothetical protein